MNTNSRLVILASGTGTNLKAIIDATSSGILDAEICAVISDNSQAFALQRAKNHHIPAIHHNWAGYKKKSQSRSKYDSDLAILVQSFQPDLIVLAGWMRLLSMAFLKEFPQKVINLHPALPGKFPGTSAILEAYQAFQEDKISETGVMVHFVPDEGIDNGPVILQEIVRIFPDDSLDSLGQRIHRTEHSLLVEAIQKIIY